MTKMNDSIFSGLSIRECEAVVLTEGVVFVCALKTSIKHIVEGHARFLSEVQLVSRDEISFSVNTLWSFPYNIVTVESFPSFREFAYTIQNAIKQHCNIYCIGAPSEWNRLCKGIPISSDNFFINPNIAVDCTEHKAAFYLPHSSKQDIIDARTLLFGLLASLSSRKPSTILFAESEQDYNYIEQYKNIYGNNGIVCMETAPNESTVLNASKVISICNSGNKQSVERLRDFVELLPETQNFAVILYSFYRRNRILETKLENASISFFAITPSSKMGIPSISAVAMDIKQQIMDKIHFVING